MIVFNFVTILATFIIQLLYLFRLSVATKYSSSTFFLLPVGNKTSYWYNFCVLPLYYLIT